VNGVQYGTDIPTRIKNDIKIFADAKQLCKKIVHECATNQKHKTTLSVLGMEYEVKWLLRFNFDKMCTDACRVQYSYTIHHGARLSLSVVEFDERC